MKKLKKNLAIILSITMVMCSTLPSVASEIEVIDETTTVGANVYGARPEDEEELVEETSSSECSSEPEEEEESTTLVEPEEETRRGERSSEPETFSDNISTESEVEPVAEISIATKSKIDSTLYGGEGDPWMYWWLTDNEDGEDTKTINYSNSDPGEVGVKSVAGDVTVNYNGLNDSEKEKITRAIFKDEIKAETCNQFFFCFTSLSTISEIAMLNTSTVTDMSYMFAGCTNLTKLDLSNFKTENVENMARMFDGCEGLTELNLSSFKVHNVVNMGAMFHTCTGLTKLDLSSFITEKVRDFEFFLIDCSELKEINFGELNTSSATSMEGMFFRCSSLKSLDLSSFNTENVEYMINMFYGCSTLEKILVSDKFVTTKVSDDGWNMFGECTSLKGGAGTEYDASHINMEYACIDRGPTSTALGYFTDATWMYWWLTDNGDDTKTIHYSNSDPGGGVAAIGITAGPYGEINYGLEIEEVEKITNAVFENGIDAETCKKFFLNFTNLKEIKNLNYLITNNVIDMTSMFDNCNELEYLDISNFNTSNVEVMEFMFTQCVKITILDLTNFNTLNVTNMSGMFLACNNLETIIVSDDFSTKSVTNSDSMFEFCISLVGGAGTNKGPVDKEYARIDGGPSSANPGYFSASPWMYWYLDGPDGDKTIHYTNSKPTSGGEGITRTDRVVYYGLTETDITKAVFDNNINAKSCANLFDRFYNLSVIEHLDYLKTSNVTRMDDMFMHCEALEILDLSSFNTENVEKMTYMFAQCYSLKKIIVSNEFVTTKVSDDGENMFDGCTNLVGGAGTEYDDSKTDKEYARIDGGPSSATPGYFTYEAPPAPPKPTPTPYIPSNDGGDGGGTGGPLVDMLIPAVTYLPIVKNILATLNNTTSKWTKDAVTNKHKLNIINQNGTETPVTLGFYNYTNVVTHIVNNVPVQTQTNDTYVFDDKGNMITGWVRTADGKWYLFEYEKTTNEGKMVIGWKKVQGAWYYFGTDGAMLTNAYTPDGHYVGPDGKWVG